MKKITRLTTINKDFVMEDLWSSYIFSYTYLFFIKNNLHNEESTNIVIDKTLLSEFQQRILTSLDELLKVSYTAPSNNELQKHSTRFEKIFLKGKVYKINYRMSIVGRLAYALYCLINFIEDAKIKNINIQIECC